MTARYEEYEEKVKRQRLVARLCDRCGNALRPAGHYEVREFELKFKTGSSYPDGGSGEEWELEDLCDDCVVLLKELLQENGFKLTHRDWDW